MHSSVAQFFRSLLIMGLSINDITLIDWIVAAESSHENLRKFVMGGCRRVLVKWWDLFFHSKLSRLTISIPVDPRKS